MELVNLLVIAYAKNEKKNCVYIFSFTYLTAQQLQEGKHVKQKLA
jgi:hypothetical protein